MATPATLISTTVSTNFAVQTPNKNTPSVSWQAGDLIVIWGFTGDQVRTLTAPTGTGLTFTQRVNSTNSSEIHLYCWTAEPGSSGSSVIASTISANEEGGLVVKVYRGHGGLGTITAVGSGTSGAANRTITLTSLDSVVDGGWGDWNAVGGARTYRTTNLGTATEEHYYTSGTYATTATWHNADATATGSQTVGITAPTSTKWTIAAIEILPDATVIPSNTGYGDGDYGTGTYGDRSGGDTTAPVPTVGTITASKISRVAGKDSTDVSWTTDEDFVEYEVRIVPSAGSNRAAGTQVETATVSARSSHTVTLTDDELVAASAAEGSNLLKVFVKDAAGNWST